jgi:hypothetical protein
VWKDDFQMNIFWLHILQYNLSIKWLYSVIFYGRLSLGLVTRLNECTHNEITKHIYWWQKINSYQLWWSKCPALWQVSSCTSDSPPMLPLLSTAFMTLLEIKHQKIEPLTLFTVCMYFCLQGVDENRVIDFQDTQMNTHLFNPRWQIETLQHLLTSQWIYRICSVCSCGSLAFLP